MLLLPFLFFCCPNIRTHLMLGFADTQGLLHSPYSKRGDCSWSLHDVSVFTEVPHKESAPELSRDLWSILALYMYMICPCRAELSSLEGQLCSCNWSIFPSLPQEECDALCSDCLCCTSPQRFAKHRPWNRNPELCSGHWEKKRVRGDPERVLILEETPKGSWSWSSFGITQIKINFNYVLSNSCLG